MASPGGDWVGGEEDPGWRLCGREPVSIVPMFGVLIAWGEGPGKNPCVPFRSPCVQFGCPEDRSISQKDWFSSSPGMKASNACRLCPSPEPVVLAETLALVSSAPEVLCGSWFNSMASEGPFGPAVVGRARLAQRAGPTTSSKKRTLPRSSCWKLRKMALGSW